MGDFKLGFTRLCRLLRKRGRRYDEAEDLVQEAYVRLLSYVDRGERILEPEAFLARTAMNLDVDHHRRERAHPMDSNALESLLLVDFSPGPEQQLATEEYVRHTQKILDETVGAKTRTAFFMHCLEGMTYQEVGDQLELSARSVERHIAKAVTVLSLTGYPPP